MKLWHKIAVAPLVAIVFLLAVGAVSYAMLAKQSQAMQDMYQQRFADYQRSSQASLVLGEVHSSIYRLLTWISNMPPERVRQTSAEQAAKLDVVQRVAREFGDDTATPEEKKLSASLIDRAEKYRGNIVKAVELSSSDVTMGAMLMQNADGTYQEMRKELDRLIEIQRQEAETSYQEAESSLRRTLVVQSVMIALAVAVAAAVAWAVTRSIVRPLKAATRYAGEIAGGDLTGTIATTSRDETGDLVRSLAAMNAGLSAIVARVRAGTDAISAGSGEIATGHRDLSRRTEDQASSLEQTAASMEELTGTVKQNAENARQANELAQAATEVAARGGSEVGEVVDTMGSISGSSKKIAEIIAVIDGIAFQTNILALNAAVEAARAGEQGRGFAVVAAEVRSLAQRCAAAAREIRELIDDSAAKVDAGSRLVGQAGATMQEVVDSIRRVSGLMAEISAASSEQTRGIEQVNVAITQMDKTTQQNAALVEQASAAAQAMRDQAGSLAEAVSAFRLDSAAASAGTGADPVAPVAVATPIASPAVAAPVPRRTQRLERRPEPALAGAEDAWDEF